MEPTLVTTACMSMRQSRDLITTGTVASVVGVVAEGEVTGGVVTEAVGVDLEAVVEGVTEAVEAVARLSDRLLVPLVQVNNCLG